MMVAFLQREALDTALRTALVAVAWPKFLQAWKSGTAEPTVSGEYSMPVGHYAGAAPEDQILKVSVTLTGTVFPFVAGMYYGPGDRLCQLLCEAVWKPLQGRNLTENPFTSPEVQDLAASIEKRFNMKAVAVVSVTSHQSA